MADQPRIVALNKIDIPAARELADLVEPELEARGLNVHRVSAATTEGLRELAFTMAAVIAEARAAAPAAEPTRIVLRPEPVGGPEFAVVATGENSFRIIGDKPAAGYSRPTSPMTRQSATWRTGWPSSGIEQALADAGATPGAEVLIGEEDNSVVFDWDPESRRES